VWYGGAASWGEKSSCAVRRCAGCAGVAFIAFEVKCKVEEEFWSENGSIVLKILRVLYCIFASFASFFYAPVEQTHTAELVSLTLLVK